MKRYDLLDAIRGITLISMILYHAIWDLVYLFGVNCSWYDSSAAYLWQQSICWTFILLSGFCWPLGRKHLKRGIMILGAGTIITIVTVFVMPEERVVFGVLTLIGSSMILMSVLKKILKRINPFVGEIISIGLFLIFRNINNGYLGFELWNIVRLPDFLYCNMVTAFLGFPEAEFYSTDYFSFFPWFFLFLTGYFLYHCCEERKLLGLLERNSLEKVKKIGKHSLEIYILHQPILYVGLNLLFAVI